MSLHQRRHNRFRPGFPEFLVLLLLTLTVITGLVLFRARLNGHWQEVTGYVAECNLTPMTYPYRNEPYQVHLTYTYQVDGVEYKGRWQGFWPQYHSPNALPPQELSKLSDASYPLKIKYNRDNPAMSLLHYRLSISPPMIQVLFVVLLLFSVYFGTRIYPHLKTW